MQESNERIKDIAELLTTAASICHQMRVSLENLRAHGSTSAKVLPFRKLN